MNKENKNEKGFLKVICIVSIIIFCIAILLVIFFNSGKTTTTGEYEGDVSTNHISCNSNSIVYPFFDYDKSDEKEMKIDAIFRNDDLASISLMYKLYYSDFEKINTSEVSNHAAMNISFGDVLGPDALNATYSKLSDNLQFSIYGSDNELTSSALKYFMLDSVDRENFNSEFIANYYNNMGMDCKIVK